MLLEEKKVSETITNISSLIADFYTMDFNEDDTAAQALLDCNDDINEEARILGHMDA